MECEYCNHVLSTKCGLKLHQLNAKYCLRIRGIETPTISKPKILKPFVCDDCKKVYTSKQNLLIHGRRCPIRNTKNAKNTQNTLTTLKNTNKELGDENIKLKSLNIQYTQELDRLHKEIHILQDKLENTAIEGVKKHTTVNTINNIIQNLDPITPELLEEQSRHLTIEHVRKGPAGYAEYALEYPFKDRIVCVDYARRKAKYKDENGKIITDPKLARLTKLLFKSIAEKNKELAINYSGTISKDLSIADQSQMIVDVLAAISDVGGSAEGEDSEFHLKFAEKICGGTIPSDCVIMEDSDSE
jgi:hypothetical protein